MDPAAGGAHDGAGRLFEPVRRFLATRLYAAEEAEDITRLRCEAYDDVSRECALNTAEARAAVLSRETVAEVARPNGGRGSDFGVAAGARDAAARRRPRGGGRGAARSASSRRTARRPSRGWGPRPCAS